jgi:hypothetical protein
MGCWRELNERESEDERDGEGEGVQLETPRWDPSTSSSVIVIGWPRVLYTWREMYTVPSMYI